MGDENIDIETNKNFSKTTWWHKFKGKYGLKHYSVFGKQTNKHKVHRARAKIVALNLITGGLINIYFKYTQERNKGHKGKKEVLHHDTRLISKIDFFTQRTASQKLGYPLFDSDLNFMLKQIFGLPNLDRKLDERFPEALETARQTESFAEKLEEFSVIAQDRNIDFGI